MARDGSGVYSLPPAYEATPGETITANQHNTPLEDLAADANAARPVVAGGTGATSAGAARTALGVYSTAEVDALTTGSVDSAANSAIAAAASEAAAAASETAAETAQGLAEDAQALAEAAQIAAEAAQALAEAATGDQFAVLATSYGQSLAMRRSPKVTTTAVTALTTFIGGSETGDQSAFVNDAFMQQISGQYDAKTNFVENAAGEGWGGGLGYQMAQMARCDEVLFYCPGDGARHFRELKEGSGRWGTLTVALLKGRDLLLAAGHTDVKPANFWTQIESDADTTPPGGGGSEGVVSAAQSLSILQQVRDDFRADWGMITGTADTTTPVFVTPLNTQIYTTASLDIQQSYINAITSGGGGIIIMPSHMQFYLVMDTDGVHLGGQGRRYYAELAASIWKRVVVDGLPYQAPYVSSAEISGGNVVLTYATPDSSDMVIDTSTFADPALGTGLYGVQFYDASGAAYVSISNIAVSGRTVTVTPSVTPVAGDIIRVAQQAWPGGATAAVTNTPRTNLRCGLSVTAEDGTVLYHYALPQAVTLS